MTEKTAEEIAEELMNLGKEPEPIKDDIDFDKIFKGFKDNPQT